MSYQFNHVLERFRRIRWFCAAVGCLCLIGIAATLCSYPHFSPWRKQAVATVTERRGSPKDMLFLYTYVVDEKTYNGTYRRQFHRSGRKGGGYWTGGPERWPGHGVVCYYRPGLPENSVVEEENPLLWFMLGAIIMGSAWLWANHHYRLEKVTEDHWYERQFSNKQQMLSN